MVGTLSLQLKCHSAASNSAYCFVAPSSATSSYAQSRQQYLQVRVCVSGCECMSPVFGAQHHQAVLCIQDQCSTAPVVSTIASREQENMVGKPYAQSLSRTQNMSPQRVPTERFQVPAQHYQTLVTVNHTLLSSAATPVHCCSLMQSCFDNRSIGPVNCSGGVISSVVQRLT